MAAGRSRIVLGVALACLLLPAAARPADPIKDPHSIACPKPPSGWDNPANGKTVESPQINQNIATLGASDQVLVQCDYFLLPTKHVLVTVNYAVADDINPQSDFYWGCSSAGTPWNTTDRVFRVMSRKQWAIAAFSDINGALRTESDVAAFEQVTRQLLRNAEGYGHACTINTAVTTLLSNFHYSFDVPAGSGSGSFWVTLPSKPSGTLAVQRVNGVKFTLHVSSGGPRHALTVRVVRGVDFVPEQKKVDGVVRLSVQVVSSKVPGCSAGNGGTLTISTAQSVRLAVCGKVFLHGNAHTSIEYFY